MIFDEHTYPVDDTCDIEFMESDGKQVFTFHQHDSDVFATEETEIVFWIDAIDDIIAALQDIKQKAK